MASDYETGFYVDDGYYGGQQFIGADIDDALESIQSDYDLPKLVHDYVYAAWEIDREGIAHDIAYEGLLDQTLESIAWNALDHIIENTDEGCGPVYGNVYWWEDRWGDSPRPPSEVWGSPAKKPKTSSRKSGPSKAGAKTPAKKRTPAKSGNARPKAKPKAKARKPATRRY